MENLTKKEIIELLKTDGHKLFSAADKIRKEKKGDRVYIRGLIEFSNFCKMHCAYCGIRAENKNVNRYRIKEEEIIQTAKRGAENGFRTIVLQSGEDDYYTEKRLCHIIEEIKKFDVAITLSIGERKKEEYKAFKAAGADRFLLRIETTNEKLYKKYHPYADFKNRVNCLYNLKELGYETGTGSLVGLPLQTVEDLAEDILFYKKLNADMIGIGPFIPHPETPLAGEINKDNFNLALKMLAITRLILPDCNIPATTAMETIVENGRLLALKSGANVIMPNITDINYKKRYEIYPNKAGSRDENKNPLFEIEEKLKTTGRTVSNSKGFKNEAP